MMQDTFLLAMNQIFFIAMRKETISLFNRATFLQLYTPSVIYSIMCKTTIVYHLDLWALNFLSLSILNILLQ